MTTQPGNAKLSPLELLARQNAAIDALTATIELLQQQVEALQRRVDAIEGVPLPQEPPEPG
jgi:vacuolar-type H+-ATPase subunit D/Vma8